MNNQPKNPLEAKLQALRDKLQLLVDKGSNTSTQQGSVAAKIGRNEVDKQQETIADDAPMEAGLAKRIQDDEVLVREVLNLLGADYDALISMNPKDGKASAYAKAVQANPAVAEKVLRAERPVLAALKVALGFQPYADFMEKYGDNPQNIREAIREEMKQEMAAKGNSENSQKVATAPFSEQTRQAGRDKATGSGMTPLAELFKQ